MNWSHKRFMLKRGIGARGCPQVQGFSLAVTDLCHLFERDILISSADQQSLRHETDMGNPTDTLSRSVFHALDVRLTLLSIRGYETLFLTLE